MWYTVRRYRLTASTFGEIFHRKAETSPDALVLRLLQQKQISSPAIEWGVQQEPKAIEAYISYQHSVGHQKLIVSPVGFLVSQTHPFLGTSSDGGVYDPSSHPHPFGFLEIKCPFKHRDHNPVDACSDKGLCCELENTSGEDKVVLKRNHVYYCQVQGQMAIGDRPWCDFVIHTKTGLSIERIWFDSQFWNNQLLPKLIEFYDKCLAPEIVSPVHTLGKYICDLRRD